MLRIKEINSEKVYEFNHIDKAKAYFSHIIKVEKVNTLHDLKKALFRAGYIVEAVSDGRCCLVNPKYDAVILNKSQMQELFGSSEKIFRSDGFLVNQEKVLDVLEEHLKQPVVSVRGSARETWDEVIVLMAKGRIRDDNMCELDYADINEIKSVLTNIFIESSVDEYEVFENFVPSPRCESIWDEVSAWVHEEW